MMTKEQKTGGILQYCVQENNEEKWYEVPFLTLKKYKLKPELRIIAKCVISGYEGAPRDKFLKHLKEIKNSKLWETKTEEEKDSNIAIVPDTMEKQLQIPENISRFSVFSSGKEIPEIRELKNAVVLVCNKKFPYDPHNYIPDSTGLARVVIEKLMEQKQTLRKFLDKAIELIKKGKKVIIQCSRGRHRSVVIANLLAEELNTRAVHLTLLRQIKKHNKTLLGSGFVGDTKVISLDLTGAVYTKR